MLSVSFVFAYLFGILLAKLIGIKLEEAQHRKHIVVSVGERPSIMHSFIIIY